MFRCTQSIFLDVGYQVVKLVCNETAHTQDASHANGKKCKTSLTEIEVVDGWVDQGEHFEELRGLVSKPRQIVGGNELTE